MSHRGQTGTSLGGRVVRRKDLKAKPEAPPVDPAALSPEALERREAYRREEAERADVALRRAEKEKADRAKRDAASGKRVINAADAVVDARNCLARLPAALSQDGRPRCGRPRFGRCRPNASYRPFPDSENGFGVCQLVRRAPLSPRPMPRVSGMPDARDERP